MQKIHKPLPITHYPQKAPFKPQGYTKWNPSNPRTSDKPLTKAYKNPANNENQFKRITPSEFNLRREKGMCYKCVYPHTLGHVCKQSHIHLLLVNDVDGDTTTNEEENKIESDIFYDCIKGKLEDE